MRPSLSTATPPGFLGGGLCPPSDGRRTPDGVLRPASPQHQDCAGEARARTGRRLFRALRADADDAVEGGLGDVDAALVVDGDATRIPRRGALPPFRRASHA